MHRRSLLLLFVCAACIHRPSAAPASPAPLPRVPSRETPAASACSPGADAPTAERISQHGTVLDAYHREGGSWVGDARLLVNEEFDFAIAMALEGGMGAGLAAARRKEHNAQKAATWKDLKLPPPIEARLRELRCCGTHVYFLLWGAETATLQTVVDVPGTSGESRVIEGPARPLAGADSWATEDLLFEAMGRGLQGLDIGNADDPCAVPATVSTRGQPAEITRSRTTTKKARRSAGPCVAASCTRAKSMDS